MAPRAAPTRHDDTARRFLGLACQLIDALLAPPGTPQPPRLRMLRYPATLEWLRIEDIFRLAAGSEESGLSRTAFFNRWATKDEFIRDAVVYALEFNPSRDAVSEPEQLDQIPPESSLSAAIIRIADGYIDGLLEHPRSFLLVHIGPLLDHHPELRADLLTKLRATRAWFDGYARLLTKRGLALRPGWTVERLGLTIQAMLDGFLFRYRIQREDFAPTRWENASLFADAVLTFCLGALDTDGTGHTARRALDLAASKR
jgi:AcrR family transcriptional regulator